MELMLGEVDVAADDAEGEAQPPGADRGDEEAPADAAQVVPICPEADQAVLRPQIEVAAPAAEAREEGEAQMPAPAAPRIEIATSYRFVFPGN